MVRRLSFPATVEEFKTNAIQAFTTFFNVKSIGYNNDSALLTEPRLSNYT